ncbi:MAG: iron export ABC transporter permease subunit FetB [Desulfuromonadales bacterium]|nr:iron export ABC transporter permease subunit FetB [Desulfuromonadales bacterium]
MGTEQIVHIDTLQLIYAYGLILLAISLSRIQYFGLGKQLFWSSIRMGLQLLVVGYILTLIFTVNSPVLVILMLFIMIGFSMQIAGSRIKKRIPKFYRIVGISIIVGCGGATFYFCLVVVGYSPWYDPRYLIPLAGMIIGNAMNSATLASERLSSEIGERENEIETALCLGANPKQAVMPAIKSAYIAALIPTINTMAATGIVALPGMMTGQILSGTVPAIAVRYQIGIMCAITGATAITTFLILVQGYRQYFTAAYQLKK